MKKIILILAAAVMTTAAMAQEGAVRAASGQSYSYENAVQVNGRAEREVVPDEIYLQIVIDETQLKVRQTVERLEQDMIARIKSLGIDTDKDLRINNMSSAYKDYFLRPNQTRTTASYELKVNGAALLGQVYQALEELGISNITITKLSHSRLKEYQNELRAEAMLNAQETARTLAGAVGQSAGKAVSIVDYNNEFYIPAPRSADVMMMRASGAGDYYETELDFREIKLSYNVTVKFALE